MSNPLPQDVIHARAVADDVSIPYYCTGRGRPVLLLVEDAALLRALLTGFPRHMKAIAPTPLATNGRSALGDVGAWLGDFLDALGLERVAIVADPPLAAVTREFAAMDPDRVTGLVLLHGDDGDPPLSGASGIDRAVARIIDLVRAEGGPRR